MKRIAFAVAFSLLLCASGTAAPQTIRVDYYHTGNAREQWFSLDRIVLEPLEWPGNPHHAIDGSQLGTNRKRTRLSRTKSSEQWRLIAYSWGANDETDRPMKNAVK